MLSSTQILPAEIKSQIAKYCSPATLCTLALVQKSFQHEAEWELYSTIAVTSSKLTSLTSLFKTLSLNRKKAELIRFLTVEAHRSHTWENGCNREYTPENVLAAKALCSVLPTLTSLTDLRVRLLAEGTQDASVTKELNAALSARDFHLHTLFCNEWLDHTEIIKNQPDLQFLGIYGWGEQTLRILRQLRAESIHIPITFCLGRESFFPRYDCIGLFPAFLLPGTDRKHCRMLQPIFERDCGCDMKLASNCISQASLFFETVGDTDYVADIILDMAECFPNIYWLILLAQQRFKLEMEAIKRVISPARELSELEFSRWHEDGTMQVSSVQDVNFAIHDDKKLKYAQEWEAVCPELRLIDFFDGVIVEKEEGRWAVKI